MILLRLVPGEPLTVQQMLFNVFVIIEVEFFRHRSP